LEAAGELGIPQVDVPSGVDMVLASEEQHQENGKFAGQNVYQHPGEAAFACQRIIRNRATRKRGHR